MTDENVRMDDRSKCPSCGGLVEQSASYCPACGVSLKGNAPSQASQDSTIQAPVVVHHVITESPQLKRRGGMSACAWVGIITISLTVVIVIVSFVGCVSCVSLFATGANQASKEMELAQDKVSHPEKYTVKDAGVVVLSAKVVRGGYNDNLQVTVKNNSGKTLRSVVVSVKTGNEYGESSFTDQTSCDVVEPERPLKNGGTRTSEFYHLGNKYVLESNVTRVMYDDNTIWPDDYYSAQP